MLVDLKNDLKKGNVPFFHNHEAEWNDWNDPNTNFDDLGNPDSYYSGNGNDYNGDGFYGGYDEFMGNTATSGDGFYTNNLGQTIFYGRQPNNNYITAHRIGSIGPYHLAIENVDPENRRNILSAGPSGIDLEGLNNLVSEPDRQSDINNQVIGTVSAPLNVSNSDYFESLRNTDRNYCDCADYDLFPGVSDGYNSNSYINSLIVITGGSTSVDLNDFIGGGSTIPDPYFQ